jgi:hypothetical protein
MESEQIPTEMSDRRLRCLVSPIIYGDIFDCPLTADDLHRFCTIDLERSELSTQLEEDEGFSRVVSKDGEFYFLEGRDALVAIRRERQEASGKAWRLARRIIRVIGYVPFIRGVLVTGSLAVNNVRQKDDLDFLVLTAPNRLWMVFGILGVLQRIFSRRFLCSNYYISTDHLRLRRESFYLAREVVQARPIFGAETCQRFERDNRWAFEFFPNAAAARPEDDPVLERRGLLRWIMCCVEWPFRGRLGDVVERSLKNRLKSRLAAHYGKHDQDVPEDVLRHALDEVELRFHGLDHENTIYQAIQEREKRLDLFPKDRT